MRKKNSLKNLLSSLIPFFILTILGFLRVNVFINYLGIEIFSLNQLFFQIFAYLSLAEGGIGALVNQQYYKLLAENKFKEINELFSSSKKLFKQISLFIFIGGFLFSFFLNYFTNNNLSLIYMQVVFVIFIFRAILEYVYYPPRIIMQADQKSYKVNIIYNIYRIFEILIEISALYLGGNYLLILILSIIIRLIMYNHINKGIYKDYPWLNKNIKNSNIKIKGIKDMMAIKLAGVAYENTDIILISSFLKPIDVTIYVSYNYITKFLNDFAYMIYSSVVAGFGNVLNKENKDYSKNIFEEINIMFLTLAVIFSTITVISINKFIALWVGNDLVVSNITLFGFILLLFYNITKKPFLIHRDTSGFFKETSKVNIIEAVLNILFSILLINKLGISGVLFGSILSSLITNFWFLPKITYKGYNLKPTKYYFKFLFHLLITFVVSILGMKLFSLFKINSFITWGLYTLVIAVFIIIIVFIIEYLLNKDFKSLFNKIKDVLFRRSK